MENFLLQPLIDSNSFKKLKELVNKEEKSILTHGIIKEALPHFVYSLNWSLNKPILLLTYDEKRSRELYSDLVNLGYKNTYFYPESELIYYNVDAMGNDESPDRLKALSSLFKDNNPIIVATIKSLYDKLMSKENFQKLSKKIKIGSIVDLNQIAEDFVNAGYERVGRVEHIGQFSIRGGIIDYYSANFENPIRIELFDDEVDSIRSFDDITQRSLDNLEEVEIIPAKELLILDSFRDEVVLNMEEDLKSTLRKEKLDEERKTKLEDKFYMLIDDLKEKNHISNLDMIRPYIPDKEINSLIDYFRKDSLIILDEPNRMKEVISSYKDDFSERYRNLMSIGELLKSHREIFISDKKIREKVKARNVIENRALLSTGEDSLNEAIKFTTRTTSSYYKKMNLLKEDLARYRNENFKIIITSGTEERGKRLEEIIRNMGLEALYIEDLNRKISPKEILIIKGSLQGGIEYPEEEFVIINDGDIFGKGKKKTKKQRKRKPKIKFTDLNVGDYIVHENHGIGRYEGVEQLDIQGVKKDYLNIKYRDGDKLYVPIDQMHLIEKYIGADGVTPSVNKLSSAEWAKTKKKAQMAVEEMAEELIELYAKREEVKGYAYSKDGEWQRQFEDYFPYEETTGQLRSTEEIKRDMESSKPMDRLLCGDVGYGKTEVALRAAFKAIMDNKQVAFLVPTTILAQQHYSTIKERFSNFPANVGILSRFNTQKEERKILSDLSRGKIDIVVGTHRLLSKDVKFKDLGLLIIDEEQRFGVKHKETLKQLKESIDVLTLTATPIPRTLHMSLSGIRDMSVLEEPPEERYPVQTYVVEKNDSIIRDAIIKEISRGGQVYFLHNRVHDIEEVKGKLEKLVPEASFGIAHGQMNETILEKQMLSFYENKFDVLVCTTIIETGLDIPNVNTIIINDADKMGLSQLYQLRGRVGRTNRIAYGYFMHDKDKVLSEIAEKRLLAIREFTEFGSGFKIAMRDLEIRGAGNLLGSQQHGQIEAIGYDLYVKILNQAIKKLKGEEVEQLSDTIVDLQVDGYIRKGYIPEEEEKVDIYKRIASIEDIEEYRDMVDELIDRYGDLPREVENLMDISYIRSLGERNNLKSIIQSNNLVRIYFDRLEDIDVNLITYLDDKYGYLIDFFLNKNPHFKYKIRKDVLTELKTLLEDIDGFNK